MADIVNIKASMETIKALVDSIGDIMADGKVDFKDITEIPSLVAEVKALVEAIKGVKAEAMDLDTAELKEVLSEGLDLVLYVAKKFGVGV